MAAQPLTNARTLAFNILGMLHMLLLASLLFGMATNAGRPPKARPTSMISPNLTLTHGIVTRQVHPDFSCSAVRGNSDCKGATECLYADPDGCSLFIQCDQNGVAWAGYCPMESMVWNDKAKLCDYSKGNQDSCKKGKKGN